MNPPFPADPRDPRNPTERWKESRKQLEERLRAEGRWDPYVARREELKKIHPLKEANRLAALEFQPLPPGMVAAAPPTKPNATSRGESAAADVANATSKEDWAQPGFWKNKKATELDVIRWVADHMTIEDVNPADCVSPAAWSLRRACRDNADMEKMFWSQMYTKLLPREAPDNSWEQVPRAVVNALDVLATIHQSAGITTVAAPVDEATGRIKKTAANPDTLSPTAPATSQSPGQTRRTW